MYSSTKLLTYVIPDRSYLGRLGYDDVNYNDFGSQVVTSEEDVTALINYNSFLGYDVVFR